MLAKTPTRSSPSAPLSPRERKAKSNRTFKEQGLAQFATFLTNERLAQLDQFVRLRKGTIGPHGRPVKSRGDALEVILARYFSDNPQIGSTPP